MSANRLVCKKEFGCEPVRVPLCSAVLSINGFAAQVMIELVEYDESVSETIAVKKADSLIS